MISFSCPICGEKMEAPEVLRGQSLECPNCGELVGVHGVNSQLTPPSDTIHTEQPIYAPQHWLVFSVIILALGMGLAFTIYSSSWETKNSKQILALSNEAIELIDNEELGDGIRKYLELEELVNNQVVTRESNLVAIANARAKFEMANEIVKLHSQEMLAYQQAMARPSEQAQQRVQEYNNLPEIPEVVSKAIKEYKQILKPTDDTAAKEELIGKWMAPADYGNGEVTIVKRADDYLFRRYANNELTIENKVEEKETLLPGRSFRDLTNSDWEILYRINNEGDLEFWDESGYISTAVRVQEEM